MEFWLVLFFPLCVCAALKLTIDLISHNKSKQTNFNLPPGPPKVPIIGSFVWLNKSSFSNFEQIIRNLRHKYGPILTLHIGSRPWIFITNNSLAHQALIENGATFADRAPTLSPLRLVSNNQSINTAPYGPLWRLFRRNLTSEILHPSRVKSFAYGRKWVLQILAERLKHHVETGEPVPVMDHFQYCMFCLLVLMCLGEKLDEKVIKEIEETQRNLLVSANSGRFIILGFFGKLGKIIFKKRWKELLEISRRRESALIPLIRARREKKKKQENPDEFVVSYVDTLFDLQIPEEGGRKLSEGEMVTLCSEFLNAGTDTTSTALQWIMANLVKHQEIQEKLYYEIERVVGSGEKRIIEEELHKIPYLKAVVLEGLRRHPPAHFVLPHAVTEDTVLDGHIIPKKATVNFVISEMGWDPKFWEDPMEFKPERFLSNEGEVFDITGTREIKMIPFGAGRRICPAHGLAMHHLEYFVANLVRDFKWTAMDGEDVDLSEKEEFTTIMKKPLQAHISLRVK